MILTDGFQANSFGNAAGTGRVSGPSSSLDVGTTLSLGDDLFDGGPHFAPGILNVEGGGTVTNGGQACVGHFTGSQGSRGSAAPPATLPHGPSAAS